MISCQVSPSAGRQGITRSIIGQRPVRTRSPENTPQLAAECAPSTLGGQRRPQMFRVGSRDRLTTVPSRSVAGSNSPLQSFPPELLLGEQRWRCTHTAVLLHKPSLTPADYLCRSSKIMIIIAPPQVEGASARHAALHRSHNSASGGHR